MLQMMPTSRIQWVEVGSIAGQLLQVNPPRSAAGQPFAHSFPAMNRGTVPNDQQPCPRLTQQMFEKHNAVCTRQRFRTNQSIHFACWRKACHHRQMITGQPLVEHRCFTFRSVGFDLAWQQVEPRFVDKNQGSALTYSLPPHFGPDLNPPALNGCLVSLDRSSNRDLGSPTQFFQQARNMVLVVRNSKLPAHNLSTPRTRPNSAPKSIGLRSMPQKLRHHEQLLWRQFGRVSSTCMPQQSFHADCFGDRQPSADCSFVDIKCLSSKTFRPSLLMQRHSPKPTPLPDFPNKMTLSHPLMIKKLRKLRRCQ